MNGGNMQIKLDIMMILLSILIIGTLQQTATPNPTPTPTPTPAHTPTPTPNPNPNSIPQARVDQFNNALKIYDDRLQDTRVENSYYSKGIEKKAEELDKQIENLKHAHNIIKQKIEQIQNLENFNSLNNELFSTNQKINKIFDILRDLVTYHPDVKKNYLTEFEKKPSKKIISGVRQYIKGNLNANELSTMKKFAFEKAKTKIYDKTYPVPKATQSPPENLYNSNYPAQKRQYLFIEPKNTNNDLNVINKKFMSKKTANYSKQENIMSYKFVDTENISRKTFNRKKTYNYGKTDANTETSKMNDFLRSPNKNIDFISREQTKRTQNIIEEENEVNNISNNSNNDINNKNLSLHFDKNDSSNCEVCNCTKSSHRYIMNYN